MEKIIIFSFTKIMIYSVTMFSFFFWLYFISFPFGSLGDVSTGNIATSACNDFFTRGFGAFLALTALLALTAGGASFASSLALAYSIA